MSDRITAAAKVLCAKTAEACGTNAADEWFIHGEIYIEDAKAMLEAADTHVAELRHCRPCNSQRKGDSCWKCGASTEPVSDGWEYPTLPDVTPIRELAKEVGYAIAVHGSLERDLDLVAAPWADNAVSAQDLIEHIAKGIGARIAGIVEQKPLGRVAVTLKTGKWEKPIDLSICPSLVFCHGRDKCEALANAVMADMSAHPAFVKAIAGTDAKWRGIVSELLERMDRPPEKNCSCRESPPCNDCVEYDGFREKIETAESMVAAHE